MFLTKIGPKKFAKKYIVWQAIVRDGSVAEPFIGSGIINAKVYLDECIKWTRNVNCYDPTCPRLALANEEVALLNELQIAFVAKEDDLPYLPQLRLIECF